MKLTTVGAAALFLRATAGAVAHWLAGPAAAIGALGCGALAAFTQIAAARLARRALDARIAQFMTAWALGVGLRFGGVVALAALMLAAPELFPPLPSTLGFLGVLLPLLFLELRLTR